MIEQDVFGNLQVKAADKLTLFKLFNYNPIDAKDLTLFTQLGLNKNACIQMTSHQSYWIPTIEITPTFIDTFFSYLAMHHMELDFTIYLISEDIEKKYMFLKFYLKDLNKKQTINVSIFDKTLVANRIFVDGRFRISHGTLKITNGYITINLPCIEELRVIMQSIGEFIDKASVTFPGETDTVNKALLATLQDCDSMNLMVI
jgi:hypothetical protein